MVLLLYILGLCLPTIHNSFASDSAKSLSKCSAKKTTPSKSNKMIIEKLQFEAFKAEMFDLITIQETPYTITKLLYCVSIPYNKKLHEHMFEKKPWVLALKQELLYYATLFPDKDILLQVIPNITTPSHFSPQKKPAKFFTLQDLANKAHTLQYFPIKI